MENDNEDNIKHIVRYGSKRPWQFLGVGPDDPLFKANGVMSEALLVAKAFEEKAAAINGNNHFTPEGKAAQLKAVAHDAMLQLAGLKERMVPVETAYGVAVVSAKKVLATTEEKFLHHQEQMETRSLLRELAGDDPLNVQIIYREQLELGNFAILDAIESAPPIWPGKPTPETMETLTSERLAVEEPAMSREAGYLNDALTDVEDLLADRSGSANLNSCYKWISDL